MTSVGAKPQTATKLNSTAFSHSTSTNSSKKLEIRKSNTFRKTLIHSSRAKSRKEKSERHVPEVRVTKGTQMTKRWYQVNLVSHTK